MDNLSSHLKLKSGKMLTIYPHPDDETFGAGGLLLRAKKYGWKTTVVTLTRGGAGKIFVHGNGRSVVEIRQKELEEACGKLKVDKLITENFNDARLIKEVDEWFPFLKKLIKKEKPSIVITYDPSGLTAHPDHIITSLKVLEIIKSMKVDERPELYWNTVNDAENHIAVDKRVLDLVTKPTHNLELTFFEKIAKFNAFLQYKSQFPLKMVFIVFGIIFKSSHEWYHKVDLKREYKHKFVDFKL